SYTRLAIVTTLPLGGCGRGHGWCGGDSGVAAELRDRPQLLHTRDYLLAGQALDALGAELLDVEGGEHRRMGHRAAQQLVGELLARVGGDVADEGPREGVAGAGRIDHVLQRIGG